MKHISKSHKLDNVLYDIRGEVLKEATRLEEEGHSIIKLNTGNPPPFGITAPDEIVHDMILNIRDSEGYSDAKGIFSARKAIMQYYQERGIMDIGIEDVYTGNGSSEVIVMSMQGLLNNGDEILIPMPDYPLWTAAANLSGGKTVHYICDEKSDWMPDIEDIKKKITDKTKGIVVINPNNPTGAVYTKDLLLEIVKIAEEHKLIIYSDEIYDNIVYDDNVHTHMASLTKDVLVVTFNGLSKSHRVPGFRAGWMVLSGNKAIAKDYIEGLDMLASMRMCSNVPAQSIIQTSLGGYQSLKDLIKPGGRLWEQREMGYKKLNEIDGISTVKPKGTLYFFPKIDTKKFKIKDDKKFIYDFLVEKKVLLVQGTGFNWYLPDHFRIVFLPESRMLGEAIDRLSDFLKTYQQEP